MKSIAGYLKLARPQNGLIVALSVMVGAAVSAPIESWPKVILACLSACLISAGGNSINDFFDLEIDRINKPYRPLPRGEISPPSALIFSAALFLLGVVASLWIRPLSLMVALLVCGLLALYSSFLKKKLLWGNLTVALVSGSAFFYGGIATSDFTLSLVPAGFAFLFHLGREVLKDAEDVKGDSHWGASTLPVKLGVNFSLGLSTLVFSLLIILTLFPYLYRIFSVAYLIVVILGVDTVLAYVIWSMWRNQSSPNLHRLSNLLKADMLLGLAAIYLGKF